MKMLRLAAAVAALSVAGSASAAINISVTPGTNPYSGPTPTYDFSSPAPVTGGLVTTGSVSGVRAQPFGSTGNYWTVGPSDGSPGVLNLSSFGDIFNISFIWGSVDDYNLLEVLGAGNTVLASFNGLAVNNPANGNQTSPNTNPLVTLLFSGSDVSAVTGLRLSSTQNAFETDNFTINAVPEPGTWAMMLLGFAAVGFSLRRSRRASARLMAVA